ncbi:radical SAM protein [Paludibacter sp. 221]|uniref:radical SAM/SPASM domain-containing protein n=1 Tax=Paludibacter sp. 221 TaxID=2302939 RepID=UPI0013D1E779|nr:radical SAM protein [Paludibacter sp. 221]NDV46741.1 radical SAM protein [Paludibacter sp. 221]
MYKPFQLFIKTCTYLSYNKISNYFKLRRSFLSATPASGLSLNDALPFFVSVEPADFCQLRCPECPVGQAVHKKKDSTVINNLLYKKLIDELKPTLAHVIFYFQGEPLLNKEIPELIGYAHNAKIYTSTSTNAQALTDNMAKKLVESGLDKLIVSVDGATQDTYQQYRVGGKLEKALQGIGYVAKWKKELKSATPLIEMQFLVLKTNEHQMQEIKKVFKKSGADKLTFKTAQLYDFENGHELLTTKAKYARYEKREDGKYHIKGKRRKRCWRLWSGAVVNVKGDVLPCCFDKDSSYPYGNINEKTFAECWHSNEAAGFRQKFLENRSQFEMCRNCTS